MDIGRIAAVYRAFAVQPEKGLDLAHNLAAGSPGLEHLPEEAFEGQSQTENPVTAVGAGGLGGQQRVR